MSLVISHGIKPIMNLITFSAITIMLIILLILVDPKLSLIVGFILGSAYGIVYKFTRSFLKRIGDERMKANEERFTIITEAFGAAKEIKIGGLEQVSTKRFSGPAKLSAQHSASSQLVSNLPRFFLEAIAFGGLVLMVLYLMSRSGTFIEACQLSHCCICRISLDACNTTNLCFLTQLRYIGGSLDALAKI